MTKIIDRIIYTVFMTKLPTKINSIFPQIIPTIKSDFDLERLFKFFPTCDPYYITSWAIEDRRKRFDELWQKHQFYADRHFLSEISKQFNSRTWEMYMTNILLNNNFFITSNETRPDYVINNNIYLECVAATKWEVGNPHSVPDMIEGIQGVPEHQILLRMISTIQEKWKYYNNTMNKNHPYIIALNTWWLEFWQHPMIPLILKALFGIGYFTIHKDHTKSSYRWERSSIPKWNSSVPSMIFEDPQYANISAVIRSPKDVLNHPTAIWSDCILVHNPLAKNPIDRSIFWFLEQRERQGNDITKIQKSP